MAKVYACLLGNWVCLNDDPDCIIGSDMQTPTNWWKEGAKICSSRVKPQNNEISYYDLDYVKISYRGKDYRINPFFIQIVNE